MKDIYYIDEAGNTGDIASTSSQAGNSEQKFFLLAGIGMSYSTHADMSSYIKEKFPHISELKSRKMFRRKDKREIFEIMEKVLDQDVEVYIELVDKKYQLCSLILFSYIFNDYTSDGVDEYFMYNNFRKLNEKLYYANSDEIIKKFILSFSDMTEEVVKEIFNYLRDVFIENKKICNLINKITRDCFVEKKYGEFSVIANNFVPRKDKSDHREYNFLPHTSSICNIIARINNLNFHKEEIRIVHDTQNEFKTPMENILQEMKELKIEQSWGDKCKGVNYNTDNFTINFFDSKSYIGIQIADVFCGFVSYVTRAILDNKEIEISAVKILTHLHRSINYVMPESQQSKIDNFLMGKMAMGNLPFQRI